MLINLGSAPTVEDIMEVMADHFPHTVHTAASKHARAAPDPSACDLWCETNIGWGGRVESPLYGAQTVGESLNIDTEAAWCRTWGVYGFKNETQACAFRIVFG